MSGRRGSGIVQGAARAGRRGSATALVSPARRGSAVVVPSPTGRRASTSGAWLDAGEGDAGMTRQQQRREFRAAKDAVDAGASAVLQRNADTFTKASINKADQKAGKKLARDVKNVVQKDFRERRRASVAAEARGPNSKGRDRRQSITDKAPQNMLDIFAEEQLKKAARRKSTMTAEEVKWSEQRARQLAGLKDEAEERFDGVKAEKGEKRQQAQAMAAARENRMMELERQGDKDDYVRARWAKAAPSTIVGVGAFQRKETEADRLRIEKKKAKLEEEERFQRKEARRRKRAGIKEYEPGLCVTYTKKCTNAMGCGRCVIS
jgi:hypothetical protein